MAFTTLLSLLVIPPALRIMRDAREREEALAVLHPMRRPAPSKFSPAWVQHQFRRTDDGAGGALQTLRRGLKFWARCMWHAAPMRTSVSTFARQPLGSVVQGEPAVQSRPLRSYLRHGLSAAWRARALRSHFTWLAQNLPQPLIDRLYLEGPVTLLESSAEQPGLALSRASNLGREGELALHLQWQGANVMSLAFSVLQADAVVHGRDAEQLPGMRCVVGALQGVRGADAALREISAACQRLRPSALLITGLQGLSAGWQLQAPLAVAGRSHVYAGYRSSRRKAGLDYDTAWQSSGGEPLGRHYWLLPARPVARPDSEVESKKRAQHRRKNALRESFYETAYSSARRLASRGTGAGNP